VEEDNMEPGRDRIVHFVGEPVVDQEGHRIGKVTQVTYEPNTMTPEWLVVKTSVFGRLRLVPLDAAEDQGDTIRVPFPKDTVINAPVPEIPGTLATSERMALLSHYRQVA
jgi:sporulation protein YlmC with PRC-barrel domain